MSGQDGLMLIVVLDTNALHSDAWLTGQHGRALVDLASEGRIRLIVPEVVRDEILRQRREAAEKAWKTADEALDEMQKAGLNVSESKARLKATFGRIDSEFEGAFAELFGRDGVSMEPTPDIDVKKLVERDLARRRPFLETEQERKKKSFGFRDVVIWETVLAVLDGADSGDTVLFVTADNGFVERDETVKIHPDLLEDLDARGVDHGRIANAKALNHVLAVIKTHDEVSRVNVATEAVYALAGEEVGIQLVHGGDYDYPAFVKFTVPGFENPQISELELVTDFDLEEDGSKVTAAADVDLYLDGAIYKGDWLGSEDEPFHVGPELNNHYFEADALIRVRAAVELDVSGGDPVVTSIELHDKEEAQPSAAGS